MRGDQQIYRRDTDVQPLHLRSQLVIVFRSLNLECFNWIILSIIGSILFALMVFSSSLSDLTIVIPSKDFNISHSVLSNLELLASHSASIFFVLPKCSPGVPAGFKLDNFSIIYSPVQGQVSQRIFGFKHSTTEYTMQLDNDVLISYQDVLNLLHVKRRIVTPLSISPLISDCSFDTRDFFVHPLLSKIKNLFYFFCVSPVSGSISVTSFPVKHSKMDDIDLYPCDWLPGCCVLHSTDSLILDDYYPFAGKAFTEDLMHSHLLISKGISLATCSYTRCVTPVKSYLGMNIGSFAEYIFADFRARFHFAFLSGRSPLCMIPAYFFTLTAFVLNYFFFSAFKSFHKSS